METTKVPLVFEYEIIKLLPDLLYPEPKMAIREVLANAADGLTVGQDFMPQGEQPCILLQTDRQSRTLVIAIP